MEKLKIAMLSIHSNPLGQLGSRDTGGMSIYVRELSRLLGAMDHMVDIYTARSDSSTGQTVGLSENVRIIHLAWQKQGVDLRYLHNSEDFDAIAKSIETTRGKLGQVYDLIHSNYWISGTVGQILKKRWRCPHLLTFHTLASAKVETAEQHSEAIMRLDSERSLIEECEVILAPTSTEQKRIAALNGGKRENIKILGCGVDMERFYPFEPTPPGNPGKDGDRSWQILYVGRFDSMKGLEDLLQSLKILRSYHDNFQLLLIGGDGAESRAEKMLKEKSQQLGLSERVFFLGRCDHDQMTTQYNSADIVVVPSRYESFGLVALEGMACGTPVVATRVGIASYVIEDGMNGYLAEPGDPASLAEALSAAINHFTAPDKVKIRSSVSTYEWENVANSLLDVYYDSLNSSSLKPC